MSVSDARLAQIANRFAELEARLASGTLEGPEFIAASRDYAELEPVARVAREIADMRAELVSLAALDDPDMRELADEELRRINAELPEAEHRLAIAMLPRDSADSRPAMLEIRAGTG
ncbi:MAG: PCRF domain-containing protein, partial [Novosphingobium sp.]